MKKKNWWFLGILVTIGTILLISGCDEAGASDGKVTVSLTNHGGGADNYFYTYLYASGETDTGESNVLACNFEEIGGDNTASFVLEEEDTSTADNWVPNGIQWIGTGGTSYDLYIYTDADDNEPDGDNEQKTDPFPITITIDGDQTVEIDYTEMVDY